jgi:photosystem II stability/assembly factor-like uncharacterized protein
MHKRLMQQIRCSFPATPLVRATISLMVLLIGSTSVPVRASSVLTSMASFESSSSTLLQAPEAVIRAYYDAINQRSYRRAYSYLAPYGRPPYSPWAAGYNATVHVNITHLIDPGYRIRAIGATYTCLGVQLLARHSDGTVLDFGGWYLMQALNRTAWRIMLPGSNIIQGGVVHAPSRTTCEVQLPPSPSPLPPVLTAVDFVNVNHGWVAGYSLNAAYILRTDDGGRHWTHLQIPASASMLDFVDANHGWALGTTPVQCASSAALAPAPCRSVLLATDNGGRTWRPQLTTGAGCVWGTLQFVNAAVGWLIARTPNAHFGCVTHLLGTTNGGHTWRSLSLPSISPTSLHFISSRLGWIAGELMPKCKGGVFFTADGGATWSRQLRTFQQCSPQVDFVNARDGWVLTFNPNSCAMGGCYDNVLYHSIDGGKHWRIEQGRRPNSAWFGLGGHLLGVTFVTPKVGWIPVRHGMSVIAGGVDVTTDGGKRWTRHLNQYSVQSMAAVSLVSTNDGWFIGCAIPEQCRFLFHTTDSGHTWTKLQPIGRH